MLLRPCLCPRRFERTRAGSGKQNRYRKAVQSAADFGYIFCIRFIDPKVLDSGLCSLNEQLGCRNRQKLMLAWPERRWREIQGPHPEHALTLYPERFAAGGENLQSIQVAEQLTHKISSAGDYRFATVQDKKQLPAS